MPGAVTGNLRRCALGGCSSSVAEEVRGRVLSPASRSSASIRPPLPLPHGDPGVAGNARLTGTTAVVLIVLLAAEGVTILSIRHLLSVHLFLGFLLIPPVLLKLASTGYRFLRYYTGSRRYGSIWLQAHQLSFLVWFGATAVHVLTYLVRAPRLALADVRQDTVVPGAAHRRFLVGGALLLGVVLAIAAAHWATPFVLYGRD